MGKDAMSPAHSEINFHDAQLADFSVGPRREVTLQIALDPVWNLKGAKSVVVRFGAIENMPEVTVYFEKLVRPSDPTRFVAEVDQLVLKKGLARFELSGLGLLEIRSAKVVIE